MQHISVVYITFGNCGDLLTLELIDFELQFRDHLVHPPGSIAGLGQLSGKGLGHLAVLFVGIVHGSPCPLAADHFQPGTAPEAHGI